LSLFNISFIRKFLHLFSDSNSTISHSSKTAQNVLLISANNLHANELTEQLNTWGYQVKLYHSAEEVLCCLADGINQDNFKALIIDQRHLNIDPKRLIEKLHRSLSPTSLTTILVGPQPSKHEQGLLKNSGYHFQVATPLDTRLLFTALHTPRQHTEQATNIPNLLDKFHEHYPRLPTKKILLAASDHETLRLARAALKSQGHTVSIAKDGQQALHILEEERFDIVVIDKELPQLNGMQVINIHHLDRPVEQWIPFILLLEEGMDGHIQSNTKSAHISKPINHQQLIKMLHTLLQPQEANIQPVPTSKKASIVTTQKAALVEQSILEELEAMGSDNHFIHQLIHLFEEDGRTTLGELAKAVHSNNYNLFQEMAHLLLGSSSFLGTKQLYTLSLHATQISQNDFTEHAKQLLEEIEITFDATVVGLFQYLSEAKESRPCS